MPWKHRPKLSVLFVQLGTLEQGELSVVPFLKSVPYQKKKKRGGGGGGGQLSVLMSAQCFIVNLTF